MGWVPVCLLSTDSGGPGCWDSPWVELYWGWWWPVCGCRVGWKLDLVGYPEGLWEVTKNSQCWFPRVPTSVQKAFGVASWKVTSSFCPSIYLTNPKVSRGSQFSLEKLKIHFSMSGLKIPALAGAISPHLPDSPQWFWEPVAHVGVLLQRQLSIEPRQDVLLLWGDQRNLTAERNRKQILGLLKFSAEDDERKGNNSLGFTYCPTFRDKITHSFPVERAEMNIRCSDTV